MSLAYAPVKLLPQESVRYVATGIYFLRIRRVTGRFYVTSDRLVFHPNRLDVFLGAKELSVVLTTQLEYDIVPADKANYKKRGPAAVFNEQLRIASADGELYFLFQDTRGVLAAIRAALLAM